MAEEVQPGQILSEEDGTRYVELSSTYSSRMFWGDAVERKVVGFDGEYVGLIASGETTVRILLTEQEFDVLVASYQQYRADVKHRQVSSRVRSAGDDYDPFLDSDDMP